MPSLNLVCLIGNIGGEPEMRFSPNGKQYTSFNLATNRSFTDANGVKKDDVQWHSITTWGKLAESCNQFLNKGSLVYVEGRLNTRKWEKDGEKHYKTEIIAHKVTFLDRAKGTKESGNVNGNGEAGDVEPDDVPFS
jgi:single-strand DNA-binding protein